MTKLAKFYYKAADLEPMSTAELQQLKGRLQVVYQYNGGTLGEMGSARTSVKAINVILRARGVLKDAKGLQLAKDATGHVAAAVAPLKADAMEHAAEQARAYVERVAAMYAGKVLDEVAPRGHARMSRQDYRRADAKRSAILSVLVVQYPEQASRVIFERGPGVLVRDAEREARFIKSEADAAGVSFDAYVLKLEGKVGQGVTAASVEGRYLWQGSVLTVTKGDAVERWHTQQIVNYSVLGNAFNQWPTRKLK